MMKVESLPHTNAIQYVTLGSDKGEAKKPSEEEKASEQSKLQEELNLESTTKRNK